MVSEKSADRIEDLSGARRVINMQRNVSLAYSSSLWALQRGIVIESVELLDVAKRIEFVCEM